jgi:hypothetical protein
VRFAGEVSDRDDNDSISFFADSNPGQLAHDTDPDAALSIVFALDQVFAPRFAQDEVYSAVWPSTPYFLYSVSLPPENLTSEGFKVLPGHRPKRPHIRLLSGPFALSISLKPYGKQADPAKQSCGACHDHEKQV